MGERRRGTRATHEELPAPMREAVDDFADHLSRVRDRSAHTVRAYVTDLVSLLDHAVRMGCADVAGLDLAVLRSWLARQRTMGAARTTMARRAAAARTFSAWAHRAGLLPHDVAAPLASPRAGRELPTVLRADQAAALMDAPRRVTDAHNPADRSDPTQGSTVDPTHPTGAIARSDAEGRSDTAGPSDAERRSDAATVDEAGPGDATEAVLLRDRLLLELLRPVLGLLLGDQGRRPAHPGRRLRARLPA
uniref:site-specific integrase n=1 Tax=Micromonospora maritima TaxID=986711 RepID=UPI0031B61D57